LHIIIILGRRIHQRPSWLLFVATVWANPTVVILYHLFIAIRAIHHGLL
jgi:hypothetical protein